MTGLSDRAKSWSLRRHAVCMAVVGACALAPSVQAANPDSVSVRAEPSRKDVRHAEADKENRQAPVPENGAQPKFAQCVVQAQQAAPKKAIACFQQLVQEYPELPEAYNNIGVLYAGMGMHVEARKWFERGLTQQQAYATLHQNLLNLQSEINRNAYAAALQLDISKSNASPKLSLIGKITSLHEAGSPSLSSAAAVLPRKATVPVVSAPRTEVANDKSSEKLTQALPAKPPSAPAVVASDRTTDLKSQSQVRETVQAWAQAWSKKDINAYLKAYSPSFNPGGNLSRSAWEEQRRARIMSKKQIQSLIKDVPPLPNFSSFHNSFLAAPGVPGGNLREAFFLGYEEDLCEYVLLNDCLKALENKKELVSTSFVIPYPPGFPILVPGQMVSKEIIQFMLALDVKEIHGYRADLGLKVFTVKALNRKNTISAMGAMHAMQAMQLAEKK